MKRIIKLLTIILLMVCSINVNVVNADSIDYYLANDLYGTTGTVINKSYSSLTFVSGSITDGVVGEDGVTLNVTLNEGYEFEKLVVEDSLHTPESTSETITLAQGDTITRIEVGVIDKVNAYNKPIEIEVTKLKYGLKKSEIEAIPTDDDLLLQGINLFDYYLNPITEITKPGIYALLLIYDSQEFLHFPGDFQHYYINDVTIDGTYYIDKEVVKNYNLDYASKEVNLSTDSENHYLYLLSFFSLPGMSLEYDPNAGTDVVTNMPANESKAYLPDAPVILNSLDIPVREGYNFLGWSLTSDGEIINETEMIDGGLKVYAIWQSKNIQTQTIKEKTESKPYTLVKTGVDY